MMCSREKKRNKCTRNTKIMWKKERKTKEKLDIVGIENMNQKLTRTPP